MKEPKYKELEQMKTQHTQKGNRGKKKGRKGRERQIKWRKVNRWIKDRKTTKPMKGVILVWWFIELEVTHARWCTKGPTDSQEVLVVDVVEEHVSWVWESKVESSPSPSNCPWSSFLWVHCLRFYFWISIFLFFHLAPWNKLSYVLNGKARRRKNEVDLAHCSYPVGLIKCGETR